MGTRGNYNGKLSEKDELIKSLREKKGNDNEVDFKSLNKSIKEKRQILEDNNVVQKHSNTQKS